MDNCDRAAVLRQHLAALVCQLSELENLRSRVLKAEQRKFGIAPRSVNLERSLVPSLELNEMHVSFCSTRCLPAEEATMEQKDRLQSLSADELWSLRKDVDAKLARILLKRKNMLERRLEQLQPRPKGHLQLAR